MKKTLLGIIAAMSVGCASQNQFYVQENMKLTKVTVHECSQVSFRNLDSGELAKREVCKDITMGNAQKAAWKKASSRGSTVTSETTETQEDN